MLYAAFGSNLDRAQMRTRCPGARVVGPGTLQGWMPSFGGPSPRRRCGVATLVPGAGHVPVLVYDVPDPDWAELDRCEGHPHFYRRQVLEVTGQGPSWVYLLRPQIGPVAPSDHYLGLIVGAHRALGWDAGAWRAAAAVLPAARLFVAGDQLGQVLRDRATRLGGATATGVRWIPDRRGGVLRAGADRVEGSVWSLDAAAIAELDSLEGAGGRTQRSVVRLQDGATAHAYLSPVTAP